MYMSMKAKTPKKKSWAQSVKDEGLISGTMDKMGITNPYAKVAAEFTPLIPGIGNYISAAITDLGRGHFKDAAWNALYALPVAGNVMKGLGMGAKALKVGRVGGIAQWGDVIGQTAAPTIKTIRDATHKQKNIMANKAQTTKKLLTSKAGKKGIQWTVGQVKKGITWLGGGQGKVNRKAEQYVEKQAESLKKAKSAQSKATRNLNKSIESVTGTKWSSRNGYPQMTGELAEMKAARDLLATAREAFKKMSGLARQKAEDEVLRSGLTRAGIGGAALLAGIPVYNALTDEPEMYDASNLQAIEPEVIEPETLPGSGVESLRYYARDTDPYWNIIQNPDGTLFINGQQFDDRDKAAAGFDNVFDYKAAEKKLQNYNDNQD